MDSISAARLALVHPVLADHIETLESMFLQENPADTLTVQQGLRSYAQQAAIYAKGRTAIGQIVTNAPPGHSWHEFGLAVDVCPGSLLATPNWSPDSPLWERIAAMGQSLGLVSGSCWQHQDLPHLQLTGRFPVSPTDEVRAILLNQGMTAVWEAAQI